jgi:hypothetical protein
MFNFAGITHLIPNPKGHADGYNYSFVGSVPLSCMEARKPTTADIMGGRVQADGFAYVGRKLETVEQAIQIARDNGANLCSSLTCACRSLFPV